MTVVGAACWTIQNFLIHQHRAKEGLSNAMHYQQQVVLLNSKTAGSAAWEIAQVAWQWRKTTNASSLQSLFFNTSGRLQYGSLCVFSTDVTKAAGNETLIVNPATGV